MGINRLAGMRCYLCGAMDRVPDGGVQWRDDIIPFLQFKLGVVSFNPCDKPINIGLEDAENRNMRIRAKDKGEFGLVTAFKKTRHVDLRMVDVTDFMIVNIDMDIHACGTYEELSWANREKKPILVHCEQGKAKAPDWLFWTIPHQHIFSTWDEIKEYLLHVNNDVEVETYNRWMFFDYKRIMPKEIFDVLHRE
jgi:hypothetical protein